MIAVQAKLLEVIKKAPQFVIPLYQRSYSWTERECLQLWDDIIRSGSNDAVHLHFVGSVVYIEAGMGNIAHQAPVMIIDGQQRITTVSLLLAALAEAVGETEPFDGFSARKIKNYYLVNPEETGERYFKLVLSQTDKDSLMAIVNGVEQPKEHSIRIVENFELFRSLLRGKGTDLTTVCKGLAKLMIVDIALTRDQDNPQLIFESMNSTGKVLSQADLIRNFILMGLEHTLQSRLYNEYWRRMEIDFGQEAYTTDFDSFMRHYLTVKTGEIPNISAVYEAFKLYARTTKPEDKTDNEHIETLVRDIREYASHFCHIALNTETDPELKKAFSALRELKVDVAYPFLLELYQDYTSGLLSRDDFEAIVRLSESYVFRRAICNIPTNSLNKTFSTFTKTIDKSNYLESVKAHFLLIPQSSYRRFPSDEEFARSMQTRDLYNFRSRTYWLRRFENHNRKEYTPVNEYTIEHIMPQNENMRPEWRTALGPEWERIQQTWLHTLGNLTLTGYNSEYSDLPFKDKRDHPNGFKTSTLRLNVGLGEVEEWTESAIKERAEKLAKQAVEIWASPQLPEATLSAYQTRRTEEPQYEIEHHQHLLPVEGEQKVDVRALYEAFRKEVLALDSGVTEEILKQYIAYKAETNFVDVVPQARGLKLILNMRFTEITDPRGICTDITGIGKWGNGDVELKLTSLEDLPYVIGLVRQSLELQLGNGN